MQPRLLTSQRSRKHPRGAALLLTVLVVMAAAMITGSAIGVAVQNSSAEHDRLSHARALQQAKAVAARVRADLTQDPLLMFSAVLSDEAPRRCLADLATYPLPLEPAAAWPATCGTTWGYTSAGELQAGAHIVLQSEIAGRINVEAFARVDGEMAGVTTSYVIGGRSRPQLWSADSASLDRLGSGQGHVTVRGQVYSGGVLDLGITSVLPKVVLAAEGGFTQPPAASTLPAVPSGVTRGLTGLPAPLNLRALHPGVLRANTLEASLAGLGRIGCLDETPTLVAGFSSTLCLRAGGLIVTTGGADVTLPAGQDSYDAYLLVPIPSGALRIYARVTPPTVWPGTLASWGEPLGEFALPGSGVVVSQATTVLGLCAPIAVQCRDWSGGSSPGVAPASPFTLIAGTLDDPRDLYLGGPIRSQVPVLAAATGSVLIAQQAAPAGEDLELSLSLLAHGLTGTAPLASDPQAAIGSLGSLIITGSLYLSRFNVDFSAFASATVEVPALITNAPFAPAPGLRFESVSSKPMTGAALAAIFTS